jgi:predicted GTPase
MTQNLWDNLSLIKEQVEQYTKNAKANEWISEKECNEILEKLEKDTLTIGVIGQMKCGKSTFLNALLFKDNVLPVASTPMTAALSVITYGEKEEVIAEFYTPEEWRAIEDQATLTADEPKIKAARELVERSGVLGSRLNSLLGTTQSASFSDLLEYVGADGKYVAITKSVTIKYPEERLKGVQVVDTPGFNDPVVSREERTTEFLAKADVVILLLYAGRAFDETDKDILFEKVKNVGTGKIIIGVNKYDLAIANGELEETIREHIISAITKGVHKKKDVVLDGLLGHPNPILLSANMALLALMPMSKIMSDEDLKWHYNEICDNFEISTQNKILEKSKLYDLENEINTLLSKDKMEILVRKPINEIQGRINSKKAEYETQLLSLSDEKKILSLNDEDLDDKLKTCQRAEKKIRRSINAKELDIKEFVNEHIGDVLYMLKKERNATIVRLRSIIENNSPKDIKPKIEDALRELNLSFGEKYKNFHGDVKSKFKAISNDLILDLEEFICGYYDDEEKTEDCMASCREELLKFDTLSIEDLFSAQNIKEGKGRGLLTGGAVAIGFGFIGLGVREIIFQYQKAKYKEELKEKVESLIPLEPIEKSFEPVHQHVDEFINFFRTRFLEELLEPVTKNIEEIKQKGYDKELKKKEVEGKIIELENKKKKINIQLNEVNNYIKALPM